MLMHMSLNGDQAQALGNSGHPRRGQTLKRERALAQRHAPGGDKISNEEDIAYDFIAVCCISCLQSVTQLWACASWESVKKAVIPASPAHELAFPVDHPRPLRSDAVPIVIALITIGLTHLKDIIVYDCISSRSAVGYVVTSNWW